MINRENAFDQSIKNNKITYKTLEKLLEVKEMITQLVVCSIIHTLKIAIKLLQ